MEVGWPDLAVKQYFLGTGGVEEEEDLHKSKNQHASAPDKKGRQGVKQFVKLETSTYDLKVGSEC